MGRKRNDEKIQVVNIRMVKEPSIYSESRISCPEDAVKAIAKDMATYDREVFAVMNLKTNGQIINLNICSMGTLDASMVSPREVFKSSILSNAASFIAIHNHPSGSLQPSQEDRDVTRRLLECGDLLNIKMLDHRSTEIGKDKKGELMAENNRNNNGEITFEIMEHIGVLDVIDNREEKWTKEVNIVAWNGGKPKIDVRDWNERHDRMSRGITLTEEQGEKLVKALGQRMLDKQKARTERDPYER